MATPTGKTSKQKSRPVKVVKDDRKLKRKREIQSIESLQAAVDELDLKATPTNFSDVPLSEPTKMGLRDSHFETLTDIQSKAIPAALRGCDILGAAKTGSGKTLAFLVPVLEKLYRARWTEYDGLGALIISPTRELSVQIFEVLRKVGRHHRFSAGLVIGGKSLKEEAERVGRMNILVCTPGRMLQHLDQTASLEVNNLQMLVLDEADRIMDMGFQSAVDALVEHLPQGRQTLLFSATQSKRVSDLARLSLKDPEYIAVHEAAAAATPSQLQQHYVVTPLAEKLDTLYGFIRANLKCKMIVFFSSGKQVRFAYEAIRHLQPGIQLLHLHGRQKQVARLEIISRFSAAKHACLFATDVVARGVDIPMVDWVVQADCPEDADTYIHRSGRTARYESAGKAILFLDPSEEDGMVRRLQQKNVPIHKVNVREKKKKSIREQLQNMCFQQNDIKYLAQKAFISYTRSVHLQKDKEVFDLDKLDLDGFAQSMGLAGAPQIRFRKGKGGETAADEIKRLKNAPRALLSSGSESDGSDGEGKTRKKGEVRTKAQRMFERTNQDVLTKHYQSLIGNESESESEEGEDEGEKAARKAKSVSAKAKPTAAAADEGGDFFSAKRVMDDASLAVAAGLKTGPDGQAEAVGAATFTTAKVLRLGGERELVIDSKRREKMLRSKKQLLRFKGTGSKLVFDDDGNAHPLFELQDEAAFRQQGAPEEQRQRFVDQEADRVRSGDVEDKATAKARLRAKRLKRKLREREEEQGGSDGSDGNDGSDGEIDGPQFGEDGSDGLALLRSLPLAGERDGYDSDEPAPPPKKQKKWFQRHDSDDDDTAKKTTRQDKRVIDVAEMPDKLEDLEALAAGLLDG
ncbi:dead box RNA helicase [Grosmannia clavigera kw1407]|uniref:ATP-dependent RNA helicase n=1 Tax=Grosmannia clavigera (strain kw1407 / UAMH 11150) TaxID=655863 RepID=F0X8B3_GROCL|nr:dead box RNA helicase [Grosmannia clavigera kw1407]EFX06167.1 dead box RNA helicase [Grosmannia clavigera kw1407]